MNPAAAGMCGMAVTGCYVPILRDQIRDGEIGIPLNGILPVRVRRCEHPAVFRVAIAAQIMAMAVIAAGSIAILVRTIGT